MEKKIGKYMQRAATRDYSQWWQKPGTFPYMMQQKRPPLSHRSHSARENYIRAVLGKQPWWIPLYYAESNTIWPDAMEECPVPEEPGFDWWGVEWTGTWSTGGLITKPGTRTLSAFENWKEELEWPDLSLVDFETDGKKIAATLDPDRVHIYESVKGCFERLHEMIPFDESLMAFYEEPELLEEFFQKMADYKIESSGKIFDYYGGVDGICYHDDWGTQKSGFFSVDMLTEQILPATKRYFDYVHSCGKFIELHSCGKNEAYVPAMLEMGVDCWNPQRGINDLDYLYDTYGDVMSFVIPLNIPAGADTAERERLIKGFVERYGEKGRTICYLGCEDRAMTPAVQDEFVAISEDYYNTLYRR